MTRRSRFCALALWLACATATRAQDFDRTSPQAFLEELTAYVTESQRREAKDLAAALEERLPAYTPEQRTLIMDVADAMRARALQAAPFFELYLGALEHVPHAGGEAAAFTEWHRALLALLAQAEGRRNAPFKDFLSFSGGYFDDGTLHAGGGALRWGVRPTEKSQVTMRVVGDEAVVDFRAVNLVALRRTDSIAVAATSGEYHPGTQTFRGRGGKVYWDRLGLPDAYVYLGSYEVDVNKSLYQVDSAKMTYPAYFGEERVLGKFADKVATGGGGGGGGYPQFTSYGDDLALEDVGGGMSYRGGFRMEGTRVLGNSSAARPAEVTLRNEGGQVEFRGLAEAFTIRKGDRVVGDKVRAAYYDGGDSITHPAVDMRFDMATRVLTLARDDRAAGRNPFYASLQDINVAVDEVKIFVDKDSVLFGEKGIRMATERGGVAFESSQYFGGGAYNRYQNIATYNPLTVVKAVAEREGRRLPALPLAKKIDPKFTLESVKGLYFDMVADGFIEYDVARDEVLVKDKLFHFVDAAQGKVDFDALRIRSNTAETNAALDLHTGSMLVNGVENLELSRKQRVALVPTGGQLRMSADRGIDFDGVLYAGYAVLEGKDFHFDYGPYSVGLDSVRFLDLFLTQEPGEDGQRREPLSLGSRIEHLAGTILIDAPNNKSGREDIPMFPSLQSRGPSYVYYDRPASGDTAYARDSFFLALDEFSLNGLDAFSEEDLSFTGTMYPADIFPPYSVTAEVRDHDRSLGHVAATPPGGWPAYGARGRFVGEVDLSNAGYKGAGKLTYLTSSVEADDFVFKPGGMEASAETFAMSGDPNADPPTPRALGTSVSLEWLPGADSMYVRSEDAAFELFDEGDGHTLEGQLVVTPDGLRGQGVHDWPAGTLRSRDLAYSPTSISADTLTLAIKTADGEAIALEATDVNGVTDFATQRGEYRANGETLNVDLPANLYKTSMNEFAWDMAEREILFEATDGAKGRFVSIDPDRDSLFFDGTRARYVLESSALAVEGVDSMRTADVVVFPADAEAFVDIGGKLRAFANARIVADTLNRHHVIDSATVEILGAKEYTASGYYRYDLPGRSQRFPLQNIRGERVGKGRRSEKKTVTRATGEVTEADDFYIDERLRFRGGIALESSRPELDFDGYARLVAPALGEGEWFGIRTPGNKSDLRIDYDLPSSPEGYDLNTGIYLSRRSQEAYPLVFGSTHTGQDRPLVDVSAGRLDYEPATATFVAGDSSRIDGTSAAGTLLRVGAESGEVMADGRLELGSGLDYVGVKAAGRVTTTFPQSRVAGAAAPPIATTALLSVDLVIPDKLLNLVAADLAFSAFDAADINYYTTGRFLVDALPNWLDEPADTSSVRAARAQLFQLSEDELEGHSFIFPRQELIYNPEYQSFVSRGDKLDLAFLNGAPVHKRLEGYLEIKMPGSGDDRLYLYLKSPGGAWYFFGYKQGILNVASSTPRFMEAVEGMKKKERIRKMDDGELYEVAPVNAGTARAFVSRVKEAQGAASAGG